MFALKNLFSTSNSVETDDLMNTKTALNRLGYYTIPPHRGIDDWWFFRSARAAPPKPRLVAT